MIAPRVAPLVGVGIVVLKSSLVLMIGWGITRALGRAPAACRHLIWLMAIVGALFAPVVDRFAPINVTVLPAPIDSPALASLDSSPIADAKPVTSREPLDVPVRIGSLRARPIGARIGWPSVLQWIGAVWSIVAIVLLVRFALGIVVVKRLVGRARVVDSADWTRVLIEAARRISVATTPRLVMS